MKTPSKNYDKQLAACYIIYMMGGSFFHKCSFSGAYEEQRMYLHYAEMPVQKQVNFEARVIKAIQHQDREVLAAISQLNCQVKTRKIDKNYEIEFFTGGFETLSFEVNENGFFTLKAA